MILEVFVLETDWGQCACPKNKFHKKSENYANLLFFSVDEDDIEFNNQYEITRVMNELSVEINDDDGIFEGIAIW